MICQTNVAWNNNETIGLKHPENKTKIDMSNMFTFLSSFYTQTIEPSAKSFVKKDRRMQNTKEIKNLETYQMKKKMIVDPFRQNLRQPSAKRSQILTCPYLNLNIKLLKNCSSTCLTCHMLLEKFAFIRVGRRYNVVRERRCLSFSEIERKTINFGFTY